MKNQTLLWTVMLMILSFSSCKKNNNAGPQPPVTNPELSATEFAKNFGNSINRSFIVHVVDEANQPIKNADVKVGASNLQTDANGNAVIKNAAVYERFAYITTKKSGYINGSRALTPSAGNSNVKIMLLSDHVTATINSGTTSNVSLPDGTKVTFDGSFKTEGGTAYSGTVNVIVNSLAASDADLFDKMPGMLFAQNAGGEAKLLETYGMMNVELRGSSGEKLQISNKAQIEMAITTQQMTNAPATMPLWHFDETLGYWKESGVANKVGNKYIGEVSHFSWWNFDLPIPPEVIDLQIKIVDAGNHPLSNIRTVIFRAGGSASWSNYTNNSGVVNGMVPKNETFTLKVYDICNNVIHTQNIGPFSTNTVLPDIILNVPATQYTTITGTLKKCDNSNVTNGYVAIKYGQQTFLALVTNGAFSFNTLICGSNTITVTGDDLDNNQNTGALNYTLSSSATNIGNILACNTSAESITWQIDGDPVKSVFFNITASVTGNSFVISGTMPDMMTNLIINGNSTTPGMHTTASGFYLSGSGLSNNPVPSFSTSAINFNVSNVGAVGQYIDVSFNGTYNEIVMLDQSNSYTITHTITGNAHVIRDN